MLLRADGAHIAPDKARIDSLWRESAAPRLADLPRAASTIVAADRPIASAFSDLALERRAGEVGAIALRRKSAGEGKQRAEIAAGEGV